MDSKEWFALGVWQLAHAGQYLIAAIDVRVKLFPDRAVVFGEDGTFLGYVFYAIGYAVLGATFLRGTDLCVKFSFPSQCSPSSDDDLVELPSEWEHSPDKRSDPES